MSDIRTDPGLLFREAIELARGSIALAAGGVAIMAAIDTLSDSMGRNGSGLTLLSLPVMLFLQYEITLAALSEKGLVERRGRRRIWALLGVSILSGLGILLGCLLLILPGLYLFVRWSLAVPILIAEEAGPMDALSRSAEEISGRFWPTAGLFLLVYLPFFAAMALALLMSGRFNLSLSLVQNLLINASLVGGWFAAVAVYAEGKGGDRLARVFA